MVLEILTVFFYVVDICMRWSKLNHLKTLKKLPDSKLKSEDRKNEQPASVCEPALLVPQASGVLFQHTT